MMNCMGGRKTLVMTPMEVLLVGEAAANSLVSPLSRLVYTVKSMGKPRFKFNFLFSSCANLSICRV